MHRYLFLAINNFAQCSIDQDRIQKHAFGPSLGSEHYRDIKKVQSEESTRFSLGMCHLWKSLSDSGFPEKHPKCLFKGGDALIHLFQG